MEMKPLYVPLDTQRELKALAKMRGQFLQAITLEVVNAGLKVCCKPTKKNGGKKTK